MHSFILSLTVRIFILKSLLPLQLPQYTQSPFLVCECQYDFRYNGKIAMSPLKFMKVTVLFYSKYAIEQYCFIQCNLTYTCTYMNLHIRKLSREVHLCYTIIIFSMSQFKMQN